jgi:hypothetical protein
VGWALAGDYCHIPLANLSIPCYSSVQMIYIRISGRSV